MNVIAQLPEQEAKKIAAGEVVERPASVVKELIENSLDAGATQVSLYIEQAGKQLIRVVDNGCGMTRQDAKLCFVNHATSKIHSLNDLEQLGTFGFRGEALASISSVSKVTLQTRYNTAQHQEETGTKLVYVDGKCIEEESIACSPGTDLAINDLFYNTPVRKKFLKQDETEWNQIQNLVQAFCLSNLAIHFKLYRDERMILNAPPVTGVKDRVTQLWGHAMTSNVVKVEKTESTDGLISNHNFWRYGRQHMFFFVNNRWVKNSELSKAVMKGYRQVLPPGRFPAVFLFLTVESSLVDINVHPRKEEVRFAKPVTVENMVHHLITKTLESLISQQLQSVTTKQDFLSEEKKHSIVNEVPLQERDPWIGVLETTGIYSKENEKRVLQRVMHIPNDQQNAAHEEIQQVVITQESSGTIIGQLLNTYIVVENEEGLLLIDQHAAHERILYEKFLKNFEQKDGTRLLFPEIITLSKAHQKIVLQQQDFLQKQGIEVEQIGDDSIAIKTSPPKVEGTSLRELVFEMIEFVEEQEDLEEEIFRKKLNEHVHGQIACKMAVKAGDVLSEQMMKNILSDLLTVDNRFICVHGRPTTWKISKAELEKKFRRR